MEQRGRNLKLWVFRGGAAAAVFVCGIILCISNPALAANLPLVGHIFEKMQDEFPISGDYNGIGEQLADEPVLESPDTGKDDMEKTLEYTKTVNGVTITLSEMYCNSQALYITTQIQSKEKFPEISGFTLGEVTGTFSFLDDASWLAPALDGRFVDENTFAGLLRFDLNSVTGNNRYQDHDSSMGLPGNFSLHLGFQRLIGGLNAAPPDLGVSKEELDAMSDEEWKTFMKEWDKKHPDYHKSEYVEYGGPWKFDLDVTLNQSDMRVVEINEKNELGIGFARVVKDRFEITMYDYSGNPGEAGNNYFPVMLDANGDLMEGVEGWVNTLEIGSHDISTVDLFLIDETLWLDQLKGIYWNNPGADTYDGKTFKEILLENCAYHKEISFEK